jgi:hypothetical protein
MDRVGGGVSRAGIKPLFADSLYLGRRKEEKLRVKRLTLRDPLDHLLTGRVLVFHMKSNLVWGEVDFSTLCYL